MSNVLPFLLLVLVSTTHAPASKTSVPGGEANACAAITRAEVEQILGRWVNDGKPNDGKPGAGASDGGTCTFAGVNAEITIALQHTPDKLDIAAEVNTLESAFPGSKVREATGIGTRAFFLDIEGAGTQLHVIRGERDYVMVSILGFGEAAQVSDAAAAIARKALARF